MPIVCSLASGSSGNCFVYSDDSSKILIDAGISCKQTVLRLNEAGVDINSLNAILITHEHTDHVKGLQQISKKFDIPIYMTKGTFMNLKDKIPRDNVNFIIPEKKLMISKAVVTPFPKSHDAAEPVSFMLKNSSTVTSVLTDAGQVCQNVIDAVRMSNILILESNYDTFMLQNGRYPKFLKDRIIGELGHLSNYEASLLVLEHAGSNLLHVFLSHLSANNNTQEIALKTFKSIVKERSDLKDLSISIAYRDRLSDIFDF